MKYYINKKTNLSFEKVLEKIEVELKQEGFGILSNIDVQATFKNKLDVDFRKYKILGACNPPFAYKSLQAEDKIGLMLPCNIIVQELEKGQVEVAAVNPLESMKAVENPALLEVAGLIKEKLEKVIKAL